MPSPRLTDLEIADPPERWQALGFEVEDAVCELGGVGVHLGADGRGITAWTIDGIAAVETIDGLRTTSARTSSPAGGKRHPNGAIGIDHVVITTPDFDRTRTALAWAGIPPRRVRLAGTSRQGFRRLGPAILEVVEAKSAPPGPAQFWGLVVIVDDLDELAVRLRQHLGEIKPAVQPGRRIVTLKRSGGLGVALAFMTPEPLH